VAQIAVCSQINTKHINSVGREYNCWMLNWWCITWPIGFKRLMVLPPQSNAATCPYRLRGPPFWLWPKCNRRLSLGRPSGVVTLPRWCEWWYVWTSTRRGLKPTFYRIPRPWSLWGSSSARENSHGRTGIRTRDLMVSSQKFWPPSHEAGLKYTI
jgi:hypothetical protein